jgi:predicted permease
MPAAVASISLCKVYGGDEHLTAGTVLLTHLAAAATVPILLALALG